MISMNRYFMKITDQHIYSHLRKNAIKSEIHVVCGQVAKVLGVDRKTIHRSVKRLCNTGRITRVSGNNRIGFTYRIPDDRE